MLSKYIKQPVKLTKWIAIGFFENESCIKQTVFQVYLCDSKWWGICSSLRCDGLTAATLDNTKQNALDSHDSHLNWDFFCFFLVQLPNELFLFRARMGNIRGWGGPLPPSWYKIQLDLQRKILTAMRNLGMAPVLPGFAGFVPDGLKRVYPQAKLSRVSRWGGFNNTYCCTYHLHSTDPLFKVLVSYSAIRALPVKNSCWG